MKNLITIMAQALVDDPDQVSVIELKGEQASVFELKIAKGDIGKIIGKKGRTVGAMRIILNAAASKARARAVLEIIE